MRPHRATDAVLGPRLILAVVAAALFGVLSMHGWGSHALNHESSTPMSPAVASVAAHAMAEHGAPGRTPDAHASAPTAADPEPASEPDLVMLGTCLAVVTALLLGLGLFRLRHRMPVPRALLPSAIGTPVSGRDRDPPDPLRLCVVRC